MATEIETDGYENADFYCNYLKLPDYTKFKSFGENGYEILLYKIADLIISHETIRCLMSGLYVESEKTKKAVYFDPEQKHPNHQEIVEHIDQFTSYSRNKRVCFANFEMNLGYPYGFKTNFYEDSNGVNLIEFCFDDNTHLYVFH